MQIESKFFLEVVGTPYHYLAEKKLFNFLHSLVGSEKLKILLALALVSYSRSRSRSHMVLHAILFGGGGDTLPLFSGNEFV